MYIAMQEKQYFAVEINEKVRMKLFSFKPKTRIG